MAPKAKKRPKATTQSKAVSKTESEKRITPTKLSSPKPSLSSEDVEDSSTTCSICAERATDWAVGSCAHVICGDCSHRMRVLYHRKTCVMCNETLKQVAVVPLRHYRTDMTFEEAVALRGIFHDKQVDMWFVDRSRHQQLRQIRGFKCSHRACSNRLPQDSVFANGTQLRAHARSEHRSVYCEVCFAGRKLFVSEMPQYPVDTDRNYSWRLRSHLRKDHPQCKFCRHYYLDDETLYAHLQERHETCSICERNGRMHEYYLNFQHLERHYAKEHYVCKETSCRGVVFATQIELQSHEHSRHNEASRGNRSRALRVDLSQLHGARDPRRSSSGTSQEVERERERQAARRRAFLSSNVVFSGAFNFDDSATDPLPVEASQPSSEQTSIRQAPQTTPSSSGGGNANAGDALRTVRPPGDGRFHPLELPRNGDEVQARNTVLVRVMRSLLDPAAYEQFKNASGQFQMGYISADEYYDAAVDAFGVRTAVRDVLPELVALLPSHLLREPLLQTCMRRTDTKPEDVGYPSMTNASSSVSAGSSSGAGTREEQFPSLGGAPAPQRSVPNMRRFGTPGPEEFPRLSRVNRCRQDAEAQQVPSQRQSTRTSYASASVVTPAVPSGDGTHPQQRTVASVVRQQPVPKSTPRKKTGTASTRGNAASSGVQVSEDSFPVLGSSDVTGKGSQNVSSERNNREGDDQSANRDPTDVSMRVGAVWGGAAARAHERAGRKRGPGKGQGKRPASPPRRAVLNRSDFPVMQGSSSSSTETSSLLEQRDKSAGDPPPGLTSQNVPKKNKVIDVMEISRARQKAAAKSNLPKIGGSGYGFSWDRKKVQKKKKEIKKVVSETANNKSAVNRHETSERELTSGPPVAEDSEGRSSTREETGTSTGASSSAEAGTIEDAMQGIHIDDTSAAGATNSAEDLQNFDPYAYLKNDTVTDDTVASFLGGTKS